MLLLYNTMDTTPTHAGTTVVREMGFIPLEATLLEISMGFALGRSKGFIGKCKPFFQRHFTP